MSKCKLVANLLADVKKIAGLNIEKRFRWQKIVELQDPPAKGQFIDIDIFTFFIKDIFHKVQKNYVEIILEDYTCEDSQDEIDEYFSKFKNNGWKPYEC